MQVTPTLYVSGPVTGTRDGNRPAFEQAARELEGRGYKVRIPHSDVAPGTPWVAAMRTCLMSMLAQADGVALLRGWELSRGACLEERVARSLGMPVMTVAEWLHCDEMP